MNDFDRDDIIHKKKLKLAVLAALGTAIIILMVLDTMEFIGKWG